MQHRLVQVFDDLHMIAGHHGANVAQGFHGSAVKAG
jgi:hypothetical protein